MKGTIEFQWANQIRLLIFWKIEKKGFLGF